MKKWLKKIKERDDIEKQAFAFWSAFFITSIIFAIWLLGTIYSFKNFDSKQSSQNASPINSIKEIIETIF